MTPSHEMTDDDRAAMEKWIREYAFKHGGFSITNPLPRDAWRAALAHRDSTKQFNVLSGPRVGKTYILKLEARIAELEAEVAKLTEHRNLWCQKAHSLEGRIATLEAELKAARKILSRIANEGLTRETAQYVAREALKSQAAEPLRCEHGVIKADFCYSCDPGAKYGDPKSLHADRLQSVQSPPIGRQTDEVTLTREMFREATMGTNALVSVAMLEAILFGVATEDSK